MSGKVAVIKAKLCARSFIEKRVLISYKWALTLECIDPSLTTIAIEKFKSLEINPILKLKQEVRGYLEAS